MSGKWIFYSAFILCLTSPYSFSQGYIDVTLLQPPPDATTNVIQNKTFLVVANVTCVGAVLGCGEVNGTVRYNHTSDDPDTQINTTDGDKPFFELEDNKTCGTMAENDICSVNWTVNASGDVGVARKIGVLFTSTGIGILENTTGNATIEIVGCGIDFALQWSSIDFGVLNPSTFGNAAPSNADGAYNITVNPGSCDLDFYIKGTNLTNSTIPEKIEVGNMSWSNSTNDYPSSFRLSSTNVAVKKNIPQITNITTWYWIDVPPVPATLYNGTIFVTGVLAGSAVP